jgi:hypothetical protein
LPSPLCFCTASAASKRLFSAISRSS